MFGRPLMFYVGRQKPVLIIIAGVFLFRLLMSAVGIPDSAGKILSITSILLIAPTYYAVLARREGLGFKELYAMGLVQGLFSQTLVALAIVVGILSGRDNIYTVPEFYPASSGGTPLPVDGKNWVHAAAHVGFAGALAFPLLAWLIGSITLIIARRTINR